MDKQEGFENFMMNSAVEFSTFNYLLNLTIAAILAYILGLLYKKLGNSLSNRNSFRKNFVVLAVTTMIIITIVKSSLALSLGLVGALSIIRFRAAIKEPEELTYLFLNIAIGLGLGANQKIPTILGFLFIAIFLLLRNALSDKVSSKGTHNLIVSVSLINPSENQLNEIVEILQTNCSKLNLKRFDESKEILEGSFLAEFNSFNKVNSAKKTLQEKFDNLTISFIDNNIIV